MKILFIAPDVFRSSGGIARYCRLACKAFVESTQVAALTVLSLHDSSEEKLDSHYWAGFADYKACNGDKKRFAAATLKAAASQRWDVLITGHINFAPLVLSAKLLSPRAACVGVAHGVEIWQRREWAVREALKRFDLVLPVSHFTRTRVIECNEVAPERVKVLYNCLDPIVDDKTQAECQINLQHPNLITVSRLGKYDLHKGHASVIDALAAIRHKHPELHYYIVGTGELTTDLKAQAQRLGVAEQVHFMGFVADEQLPFVYQQADVYIMPSTGEGFGFVFAEAMAHGKPCIAGNKDASPEVVRHNQTGLIVEPRDVGELAVAITKLVGNEPLRKQLGANGIRVVAEEFSFAAFQRQMMNHLQSIC